MAKLSFRRIKFLMYMRRSIGADALSAALRVSPRTLWDLIARVPLDDRTVERVLLDIDRVRFAVRIGTAMSEFAKEQR